jgi:hypothetical protein
MTPAQGIALVAVVAALSSLAGAAIAIWQIRRHETRIELRCGDDECTDDHPFSTRG